MRSRRQLVGVIAAIVAGCASAPPPSTQQAASDEWKPMPLPGKAATRYEWSEKDGRRAIMARSEHSASLWRKRLQPVRQQVSEVRFSWWVQDVIADADLTDIDRGDAPARVMFAFDGDVSALPLRTRMLFEVAQALTGEQPPYATLSYVYDTSLPVGTVVVNPRSDRVRSIVVDSGTAGLRRWRDHRRNLAADFRHAFGEEPGPLTSVALMTDSDNTRSMARAWYGPVELR